MSKNDRYFFGNNTQQIFLPTPNLLKRALLPRTQTTPKQQRCMNPEEEQRRLRYRCSRRKCPMPECGLPTTRPCSRPSANARTFCRGFFLFFSIISIDFFSFSSFYSPRLQRSGSSNSANRVFYPPPAPPPSNNYIGNNQQSAKVLKILKYSSISSNVFK